ncbi:putative signal transducing protein [Zunongwangia pacifica]|uniref:DUF2007 domain-containing protein n=1 Tax=Zunongwangia pacifica TaxID=2911062 RepID=A0A9X1ZXT0_9FLAO|nr:DUF2007 domain-containing protein [Zunongwangia pacifica]MCL6218381.1 DUF2007 domain-containing protein [Zunongwangia pacifica]
MHDYTKILTSTSIIINRIASLLTEKNISIRVRDNVESGRLAGFGVPQNDVELFVLKSEYQKAQEVIADSDIVLNKE